MGQSQKFEVQERFSVSFIVQSVVLTPAEAIPQSKPRYQLNIDLMDVTKKSPIKLKSYKLDITKNQELKFVVSPTQAIDFSASTDPESSLAQCHLQLSLTRIFKMKESSIFGSTIFDQERKISNYIILSLSSTTREHILSFVNSETNMIIGTCKYTMSIMTQDFQKIISMNPGDFGFKTFAKMSPANDKFQETINAANQSAMNWIKKYSNMIEVLNISNSTNMSQSLVDKGLKSRSMSNVMICCVTLYYRKSSLIQKLNRIKEEKKKEKKQKQAQARYEKKQVSTKSRVKPQSLPRGLGFVKESVKGKSRRRKKRKKPRKHVVEIAENDLVDDDVGDLVFESLSTKSQNNANSENDGRPQVQIADFVELSGSKTEIGEINI